MHVKEWNRWVEKVSQEEVVVAMIKNFLAIHQNEGEEGVQYHSNHH
jgi:hypothetical protein